MANTDGTKDNDNIDTNESADFSDDPPTTSAPDGARPSSGRSGRHRRSVSGMHRDGRALGMSGPSIRRASKSKNQKRVERLRIVVTLLVIASVVTTSVAILSWNQKRSLKTHVIELSSKLRVTTEDLNEARDMIRAQEAELRAIKNKRL